MSIFTENAQYLAFSVPVSEAPFSMTGTLQLPSNYICVVVNPDGTTSQVYNPISRKYIPLRMSLLERTFSRSTIYFIKSTQFTLHYSITGNHTKLDLHVLAAADVFNAQKMIQAMGNESTLTIGTLAYLTKSRILNIVNTGNGNIYAEDKYRHAKICDCLAYAAGIKVFTSGITKAA